MGERKKSGKEKPPKSKAKAKSKAAEGGEQGVLDTMARAAGWVAGVLEIDASLTPTRDLFGSINARRSHKRFKTTPVDPEQIGVLLNAAVTAPNHKMTEPRGFLVLGPRARRS